MNFETALGLLKSGTPVCRSGWNGKMMWIILVTPNKLWYEETYGGVNANLKALPWIGMRTANKEFVPWLASQTDLLAEDWEVADLSNLQSEAGEGDQSKSTSQPAD